MNTKNWPKCAKTNWWIFVGFFNTISKNQASWCQLAFKNSTLANALKNAQQLIERYAAAHKKICSSLSIAGPHYDQEESQCLNRNRCCWFTLQSNLHRCIRHRTTWWKYFIAIDKIYFLHQITKRVLTSDISCHYRRKENIPILEAFKFWAQVAQTWLKYGRLQ